MAQLQTAQTWAREHANLLGLALKVPAPQTCTLHLLTPNSMALRSLLHAPVRVHLVVRAGGVCVATRVG
jgi:hypothetical protein